MHLTAPITASAASALVASTTECHVSVRTSCPAALAYICNAETAAPRRRTCT